MTTLACGHQPSAHGEHTTGTATMRNGWVICWECCADLDRGHMLIDGHSRRLPLYLSAKCEITNWPGTLRFKAINVRVSKAYAFGRVVERTDVWFVGPDDHVWHGKQIGDFNTICHAKRTREVWRGNLAALRSWRYQ